MQTVKVTIAPLRISLGNFQSLSYCISQKSRKYQKSLSQIRCFATGYKNEITHFQKNR